MVGCFGQQIANHLLRGLAADSLFNKLLGNIFMLVLSGRRIGMVELDEDMEDI